ncbi:MAG: YigZ family protein [Planctomycetota bacterium]
MTDSYRTLARPHEHEPDKIKGSRHIANLFPVADAGAIEAALDSVRKRLVGANHHAFAWRLGRGDNEFRYSDDGEPSGSAGRPILQQIDGRALTDVLVVVTRFFGGTKLGTGGLVRAYGGAAAAALDLAEIVEVVPHAKVSIRHSYDDSGAIASVLSAFQLEPESSEYGTDVTLLVAVEQTRCEEFVRSLTDATGARALLNVTASDRAI